MLRERAVVLLQAARELRRVAEAVEEAAEDLVRPLLRLPPFGAFTLVLVFGNGIRGDLEPHDVEEEISPRSEGLGVLLMLAELEDDGRRIGLEDEVEESGGILVRGGGRALEALRRDVDESGEEFVHKLGEDFVILAESARKHASNTIPDPYDAFTHRKARTISRAVTHPACTSRMLPLESSFLTSSARLGHCSGKSRATTFLSAPASCPVMEREGLVTMSGIMEALRLLRSEGGIGTWSGRATVSTK